jgi:hypothetical protein
MSASDPGREVDAKIDDAAAKERGAAEARRVIEKRAQLLLQGADISTPPPLVDIGLYPAYGSERAKAKIESAWRRAIGMIREGKTPKEPMREIAQLLQQPSCQGADIASFAQSLFIEFAALVGRGMWDIKRGLDWDDARERAWSKGSVKLELAEAILLEKKRTGCTLKAAIEKVAPSLEQRTAERILKEVKQHQKKTEELITPLIEIYEKAGVDWDEDKNE